jgi:hypothetical protein
VLGTAGAVVVRPVLLLLAAQAAADLALVSGLVALRMSTRREQRRRAERRRLAAEAMRRAAAARIRPAVAHIDLVAYERAQEAATSWAKPRAVVLPDTALPDAAIREVVLPGARAAYDDEPVAVNY